ncbi:hypothetical protein IG631_14221 [Alternaria alternata]|nr:hypothetical protein IG631_14221 [Alternaria alternata]
MVKRSSASSDKDFSLAGVYACVWMRSLSPIPIKRPKGICTPSARSLGPESRHTSIVTAYRSYTAVARWRCGCHLHQSALRCRCRSTTLSSRRTRVLPKWLDD